MPRVYGGSPGLPSSRAASHPARSSSVYRRRIGELETVVNSFWRSGLFSRVGRRVFSSQACSFERDFTAPLVFFGLAESLMKKRSRGQYISNLICRPHLKLMLWERAAGSKNNDDKCSTAALQF